MEQMHQEPAGALRWQIVKETPREEDQPVRFAVLRGESRVAWGLRDQDAAARWLRRLGGPSEPASVLIAS